MSVSRIKFGSQAYADAINETYDNVLLKGMDIIGRDDFYGIAAWKGLAFFGKKLKLTRRSHLLDLCSGIGGPARFLADAYGCNVTGIDLSEFNHRAAQKRTKKAGLDHLVSFRHGDALDLPFEDESFTHVLGCESWCYFPDKVALYRAAKRVLRPGGIIAFLEAACETPVRLHTEDLLGLVRYESIGRYTEMLKAAGFTNIRHYDTTNLASRDVARSLYQLVSNRERVLRLAGGEVYFGLLELWAEFIAYFSQGKLTHCGFVAVKPERNRTSIENQRLSRK
ncbi:MAG TPA: methyltransferase domain-containing protein [Alphaproteobacteria bacterium]|nr:methyltransferase domain-containing protein [Alphaproteobacteria bacterium]